MLGMKGAANAVNEKDVAPNWKILQMKLNEEKQEKARLAAEQPQQSTKDKIPPSKNALKRQRARKRKADAESATSEETKEKKAKADTVKVGSEEIGELTKHLAMDCEYVGVGAGGREDALARVSIVNEDGKAVYNKYVKVKERVVDYRTDVSGIRPGNLTKGELLSDVQQQVRKIIADRVIVGHALHNDFRVLGLAHPKKLIRDTAKWKYLRDLVGMKKMPSLKHLAKDILALDFQQGEHDSIMDARVALRIYLQHQKLWEKEARTGKYH